MAEIRGRVRLARLCSCLPLESKFSGASHRSKAAFNAGHSLSIAANHAVSRLAPFMTFACRDTPSKLHSVTTSSVPHFLANSVYDTTPWAVHMAQQDPE